MNTLKVIELLQKIANNDCISHGYGYTGCECHRIAKEALEEFNKCSCGGTDTWFDRTITYNPDGTEDGMKTRCSKCGEALY